MARTEPILIACPQYRVTVRGTYECDTDGVGPLWLDGRYILDRLRCNQYGGRCMQTLCALHRYNNRGPGSWYPEIILTLSKKNSSGPSHKAHTAGGRQPSDGTSVSLEA